MQKFKQHIVTQIKKQVNLDLVSLDTPPEQNLGDFAFPTFSLAKQLKKAPPQIAEELAAKIAPDAIIEKISAAGPFVNFTVHKTLWIEAAITSVLTATSMYGSSTQGKNKKIILEHTSINPNASPHVGRARNALIGDAMARLYRFIGHEVEVHYFVNDVGKQIAMLVLAAGNNKDLTFEKLLSVYINIAKKVADSKDEEQKVFDLLHAFEQGNKDVQQAFSRVVSISLKGQKKLLAELDIHYDHFDFESEYLTSKKTEEVLRKLEKTGKFFFDKDKRFIMDLAGFGLGMKTPVLVLTRGDGTSLYPLRDIAYVLELTSKGAYHLVLGEDQKLYHEQINAVLSLLNTPQRTVIHYSFVLLEDGKMSTRKGNLVLLEDFMKEAQAKASEELQKRNAEADTHAARVIGYGALKYAILKITPDKNVTFNWKQALSFDGEASPYIQYAYARCNSLRKKSQQEPSQRIDVSLLSSTEEVALAKTILDFPECVIKAAREGKPNLIANYAFQLAQSFTSFYHAHQIVQDDTALEGARISLVAATQQTLKNSLALLGIDVLETM